MWFRALIGLFALLMWLLTIWMGTHVSEDSRLLSRYSYVYFAMLVTLALLSAIATIFVFPKPYQRIHGGRHNFVLVVVSVSFTVGLFEFLVRVLDPIGISYYAHSKRYHLDKLPDDDLYYRMVPNALNSYQGVSVRTNSTGFRNGPVSAKSDGEFRILFLGDSVTFGWGVEEQDSFVHRVGEVLESESSRTVSTINTGVGSYNTDNERAVLDRYGQPLQPDLVVLVYVGNDISPTPDHTFDPQISTTLRGKSPPQVLKQLLGHSWIYRLASHVKQFGAAPSDGGANRLKLESLGWQQSSQAMNSIAQTCDELGVPLVVFMYRMVPVPMESDIAVELNAMSSDLGYRFVDMLPWFQERDVRLLVNSVVDSHPNPDGHEIIADEMASIILGNYLSADFRRAPDSLERP